MLPLFDALRVGGGRAAWLEQLFGRKIDLVTASALENPYFIAAVNKSRQTVYQHQSDVFDAA